MGIERSGRRRLASSLGLIMAAVILLSGCVGIPSYGGVHTGPVIGGQLGPEFVVLPSSPVPGSSQTEILNDFMQAVRAPQNDYAVARQYLSSGIARHWDPDASALIRTAPPTISPSAAQNSLDYSVTGNAYVDATGRYIEQDTATQTLQFGFTQEKGEWRISQAPNGIVLSQASFNVVFTQTALYFFDPSRSFLVPDVRWFPSRSSVSVRIVSALLAGPSSWLQQGVVLSAFPVATVLGLNSVQVTSGLVTVDLSTEALSATPADRARMRQQLVATLGAALGISTLTMTVGGLDLRPPDPAATDAVVNPTVDAAMLLGTGDGFGFSASPGISPIPGLSPAVVAGGATSAVLAHDKQSAVFLGTAGHAFLAEAGGAAARVIDSRPNLIAPTIDPFKFVWSAQAGSASSLRAFAADGTEHRLATGLADDARIVSMNLSRDGTRLLLYLTTPVGPVLEVAGIIRGDANAPTKLGAFLTLTAPPGAPIDATWVDDRTVATVSQTATAATTTVLEIGGPSQTLGLIKDAVAIVGGNGGTNGLRVLRVGGAVWRPQGSGGWVSAGVVASFLGTMQ